MGRRVRMSRTRTHKFGSTAPFQYLCLKFICLASIFICWTIIMNVLLCFNIPYTSPYTQHLVCLADQRTKTSFHFFFTMSPASLQ
jgi:hypothetical protein